MKHDWKDKPIRKLIRDLVKLHDTNTCTHEETHRGGAIWTICDSCGRQWSDDRNPFTPYVDPEPIAKARELLSSP